VTGERMGFYDPATGTVMIIMLDIIVFSTLTFIIGQGLSRRHAARYHYSLREANSTCAIS